MSSEPFGIIFGVLESSWFIFSLFFMLVLCWCGFVRQPIGLIRANRGNVCRCVAAWRPTVWAYIAPMEVLGSSGWQVKSEKSREHNGIPVQPSFLPPQSKSLQAAYNTIVSTEWFGIRINWQGHSWNCTSTMLWQCSLWDQGILRRYNNDENLLQTRENGKDCSKNTAVWRFRYTEFADRSWISDQMSALVVSKIHVSNVRK